MRLQEKARMFAVAAHDAVGQKRKYTGVPYWTHCAAVADLVAFEALTVMPTDEMIAAAWLHDVVEDTQVTGGTITYFFGDTVWNYVAGLTDIEQGNRKERKRLSCERLGNACAEVQTIKLADLIDNTSSILQYDPEFAKVYMREKVELLDVLTKGDKGLWTKANKIVADYYYDKDG